jgi:hypothetical protein
MRKTLTLLAAVLAFVTTSFAQTEDGIKWEKKSHDFGSIKMGPKADVTFRFTNTTKAPVVITSANPSCPVKLAKLPLVTAPMEDLVSFKSLSK